MIKFELIHPKATFAMLGHIPTFLDKDDQRDAVNQIAAAYRHGGGWNDFEGHRFDKGRLTLTYPGDPPMHALAKAELRDETLILFQGEWFMVLQKNGSFRIAKLD